MNRKFEATVTGKRYLNGSVYQAVFDGAGEVEERVPVYELLRQLADFLEEENKEMEYPSSLTVTVSVPKITKKELRKLKNLLTLFSVRR